MVEGLSEKLLYAVRLGITEPHNLSLENLAAILAYDIEASKPVTGATTQPALPVQLQRAEPAAAAPMPSPLAEIPPSAAATSTAEGETSSKDITPCGEDISRCARMAAMPAESQHLPVECLRPAPAARGAAVPEGPSAGAASLREAAAEPAHDTDGRRKSSSQCASAMEDPFGEVPRDAGADCAPGTDDPFGGVPPQAAAAAQPAPHVARGTFGSALQQAAAARDVPDASVHNCCDMLPKYMAPAAQFGPAAMGLFPSIPCSAPAAGLPPSVPGDLIPGMLPRAVACA